MTLKVSDVLSDVEAQALIMAFFTGRMSGGDQLPSLEGADDLLVWAVHVRTNAAFLELALRGHMVPEVTNGQVTFRTRKAYE